MEVKQFFELLDAIRYDDSIDEVNPELRGMARQCYPVLRKLYNMMLESDLLSESKRNIMKLTDSDINYIVMESAKRVVEAHGSKKHNMPKDKNAAQRKGNRDAEKDIYGDGFKSKEKTIKKDVYSRKNSKVNINNINIDECIRQTLKEFINNWDTKDYKGNDLNYDSIYNQAITIIGQMEKENVPIDWSTIAKKMNFDLNSFNESDMEILHDAIEDAMADCSDEGNEEGYYIDMDFYDINDDIIFGSMSHSFEDMWEAKCNSAEEALQSLRNNIEEYEEEQNYGTNSIPIYTIVYGKNYKIVKKIKAYISTRYQQYANDIRPKLNVDLEII